MKIVEYKIEDGKEYITFQRFSIEETGKMDTKYSLWRFRDELYFGLLNAINNSVLVGLRVEQFQKSIISYIQKLIATRKRTCVYTYYASPPQMHGECYVQEILPSPVEVDHKLSSDVCQVLKEFLTIIQDEINSSNPFF